MLAEFLGVLGEVDVRKLYLEAGFSSLYAYCREGLDLSEDQAYRRVACCRVGRKFPAVLPMLASGDLHMSGLAKLAPHLDETNHVEVLAAARGCSKAEIELLIATLFGSPTPAGTCQLRFAVTAEAKALLDRARALMPDADIGEIFERAMEGLVERLEKQKFKTTERPRSDAPEDAVAGDPRVQGRPSENARRRANRAASTRARVFEFEGRTGQKIPAAVKRVVHERDGGRCTYVSPDGRRCSATSRLEFDHIEPTARGGKSTTWNIRLLCKAHNQYAAEQLFGRKFIAEKRRSKSPCPVKAFETPLPLRDIQSGLRNLGFGRKEAQWLPSDRPALRPRVRVREPDALDDSDRVAYPAGLA